MKNFFLFSILLISSFGVKALNPGSIAFIGYQTNAPDGFAFITLEELPALTQIHFTDNGWDGSTFFDNEEMLTWTSPATALPAGAVVYIYDDNVVNATSPYSGPGTVTGELPNLSSSGDQVLAFSGTTSSPVFVAAITSSDWLSVCSVTANSNATCLPAPLVNGQTAQAPVNSITVTSNMFFNQAAISGTPAQILALIMNPANWTISNEIGVAGSAAWPAWNVSVTPPAASVVNIAPGTLTLVEGAVTQSFQITFSTPVFGTQTFSLALSGALTIADLVSSPGFTGNTIIVTVPPGSTLITIDIAATADGNPEGQETGTLTLSALTTGLSPGNNSSIAVSVNEPDGVSIVQFESAFLVGSEEDQGIEIILLAEPSTQQPGSVVLQVETDPAVSAADYSSTPSAIAGTITFNLEAGASNTTLLLDIADDLIPEGAENIRFTIISASEGFLAGSNNVMTVTIASNDDALIPQQLFINEVMSSNTYTTHTTNGDYSDWIELYNAGSSPVDLAGLFMSDDISDPYKYMFPEGSAETIIPAGGFKILWADDSTQLGPLHLNFRISSDGEYLSLNAAQEQFVIIDSVTTDSIGSDESWGRITDGTGNWITFGQGLSTPEISNLQSGIKLNDQLEIVVYPNPATDFLRVKNYKHSELEFVFIDALGKTIKSGKINGDSMIEINCEDMDAGIYFLHFGLNGNSDIKRIAIIK